MAKYDVSASVTSPPTDVDLEINKIDVTMARDTTGAWAGSAQLDLPPSVLPPNKVPIAFIAVGISGAPWTLEIKFTPKASPDAPVTDFKHDDKIPPNMRSAFSTEVSLKQEADS